MIQLSQLKINVDTPIKYAVVNLPIGECFVAWLADRDVLCALYVTNDWEQGKGLLGEKYGNLSKATLEEQAQMEHKIAKNLRDGADEDLSVALDVTNFQYSVLQTLTREVGNGRRVSYSALAAMCGRSSAVRAVASAVARNPVSLLVPCHRVVPQGGGTGHYRWGTAQKAAILEYEQLKR